ncbi:MAG TPA: TPM domain-containing protein [Desulfobacteraceae bacterium]|nr:TPM domain-containing protein [Desulfobacteraceae bacterium]HPJ67800.1 TPM domain-containing protein [Desulfobacteraceae bacterium]HPQ28042.1 TPM domain-containing protein [Desulfobacteraceae bacterium]
MLQTLSDYDRRRLDELIAETEKTTGTQIVLAVIRRSDTYAELPWKAFALGASIAGLLLFALSPAFYDWSPEFIVLIAVTVILACGALLALLTVLIPVFARVFLSAHRAEVEVQQYAESLFLAKELFATSGRTGILMMVSLFERRIVIIPDSGLDNKFKESNIQSVIASMAPLLKQKEVSRSFEAGLKQLAGILGTSGLGTGKNELPDEIIEEKGI